MYLSKKRVQKLKRTSEWAFGFMEGDNCAGANEHEHVWIFVDPYTQETDLLATEHTVNVRLAYQRSFFFRKK